MSQLGWADTGKSQNKWNKEKIVSGFQGLSRSKRAPTVKLSDGSCMVLGRGTFLGKDTQDMAQLLNCGKKTYKEVVNKIYIHF